MILRFTRILLPQCPHLTRQHGLHTKDAVSYDSPPFDNLPSGSKGHVPVMVDKVLEILKPQDDKVGIGGALLKSDFTGKFSLEWKFSTTNFQQPTGQSP